MVLNVIILVIVIIIIFILCYSYYGVDKTSIEKVNIVKQIDFKVKDKWELYDKVIKYYNY